MILDKNITNSIKVNNSFFTDIISTLLKLPYICVKKAYLPWGRIKGVALLWILGQHKNLIVSVGLVVVIIRFG